MCAAPSAYRPMTAEKNDGPVRPFRTLSTNLGAINSPSSHFLIRGIGIDQHFNGDVSHKSDRTTELAVILRQKSNFVEGATVTEGDKIQIKNPLDGAYCVPSQVLEPILDSKPTDWSYRGLDRYARTDPIAARCLRSLVEKIKPSVVVEHLGSAALLFCAAYARHPSKDLAAMQHICNALDRDQANNCNALAVSPSSIFKRACAATDRWVDLKSDGRLETVLLNYSLFCSLLNEFPNRDASNILGFNINEPLAKFRRSISGSSLTVANKTSNDYSLQITWPGGNVGLGDQDPTHVIQKKDGNGIVVRYGVMLDAFCGLTLLHKGLPQAVVTFLATDPTTLSIVQIQGIQGRYTNDAGEEQRKSSRGLVTLDYKQLLIKTVMHVGHSLGFGRIGMLGASNNPSVGSARDPSRQFKFVDSNRNYNDPAGRAGMDYDPLSENFYAAAAPVLKYLPESRRIQP